MLHQQAFPPGWTEHDFEIFLNTPSLQGLKGEENKNFLGYLLWREVLDEAEILTFIVNPTYRGTGKGTKLLKHLCATLKNKGIKSLFLEVAEDNLPACSFYKKEGFIFLSKRPHYYPRGKEILIPALNFRKDLV